VPSLKIIEVEVESGIPIPPRSYSRKTGRFQQVNFRYPWSQMDVSDSFFVPLLEGRNIRQHQVNVQVAAKTDATRSRKRRKYVTRIITHKGQRGVRVWRIT